MILTLLLLPVLAITANPFHKYPYVFLLDVGNEELEKVNTEQIRLSCPGGSVALRYPAIGYGDDIAHVRVSGIDFGTDLKANILDGGPGYKYVVFVLMGNSGVAYDAVITIQTVPIAVNNDSLQTVDDSPDNKYNDNPNVNAYEVPEEENISAEESNDDNSAPSQITNNNSEQVQESSNVYSYAQNEALSGYGSDDDDDEDGNNNDNDDNQTDDDVVNQGEQVYAKSYKQNSDVLEKVEVENYDTRDEDLQENQQWPEYNADKSQPVYRNQPIVDSQNVYKKLKLLDNLYNGPQGFQLSPRYESYQDNAVDIEEAYNDYEESDPEMYKKFRDMSNNINVDSNGASAVAY